MLRKITNNNKGSISVIITSTVVLILFLIVSSNLITSILHITTRNSIRSLLQTEVDTVVKTKVINDNVYEFFNKDISSYLPILKNYSTTYTIYDFENGNIVEKSNIDSSSGLNLNLTSGEIVKISVKQTSISQLQKLTNLLSGENNDTSIVVSVEGVVK